jgi:hypothetical protein
MDAPGAVEYEPASVKELLAEMKDTAELLIGRSNWSNPISRCGYSPRSFSSHRRTES